MDLSFPDRRSTSNGLGTRWNSFVDLVNLSMHNSDTFSSRVCACVCVCIESLFKIIEIVFIIAIDDVIIKDASLARIRCHSRECVSRH